MHVKVDFSESCKNGGYDIHQPGTYAIYIRKHWWNKWIQKECYDYLDLCKIDAKRLSEPPIHYK